ncbi:hypothetical protein GSB9_02283 [Flavobacteriaceae bacterium GSB9]|nr:hypothetical protein GSB9_02283 [Flavobacteriaceae bacterium GSB9]
MLKHIVSIFFTSVFVLFLMAPTAVAFLDDSVDVSVFFTTSEEEEKGGKKNTEKELLYYEMDATELEFAFGDNEHNLEYYQKKYPNPHLKLTSPPPKVNIL